MNRGLLYALVLVAAVASGGCGFHLRGSGGESRVLAIQGVYLQEGPATGPLAVELRRALKESGATLADRRDRAKVVLELRGVQRDRRVLSVGTAGTVQEYELHYGVTFAAQDGRGHALLQTQSINLLRDLTFSEADVLAKGNEEDRLYQTMRDDAIQQIMRRLESALNKHAANKTAPDK